jgi:hypothetical protein
MKSSTQPSTIKVQSPNIIQDDLREEESDSFLREEQPDMDNEVKEDFERGSPESEEQAKGMYNIEEENSEDGQEEVKVIEKVIYLGNLAAEDEITKEQPQSNLKEELVKEEVTKEEFNKEEKFNHVSKDKENEDADNKESMFNIININTNAEAEHEEDVQPVLESEEQELQCDTNIHHEPEKKLSKKKSKKTSTFQAKNSHYVTPLNNNRLTYCG